VAGVIVLRRASHPGGGIPEGIYVARVGFNAGDLPLALVGRLHPMGDVVVLSLWPAVPGWVTFAMPPALGLRLGRVKVMVGHLPLQ
jgi:hypothetical protein